MNPIPAIRLIAVLLMIMSIFYTGWTVRGWRAERDISELKQAHLAEREAQVRAVNEAVASVEESGRKTANEYETKIRGLSDASDKLRRELRNAEAKSRKSGNPVCAIDPEWVRIYNEALRSSNHSGAPSGESSDSSKGANPDNARTVPTNEWDVAWVHAENATRWAECRAQLNALIDFETSDAKGVVTQQLPLK